MLAIITEAIRLVQSARLHIVKQTNSVMVFTCFQLGRLIFEQEHGGNIRAEYGKETIQKLSEKLTSEFWCRFFCR